MTALSPNFSLEDLSFSQEALRRGIDNSPNAKERARLKVLAFTLLEPAIELLGVKLHADSGFRCSYINALVGGATNSAHLEGRAADVKPIGLSVEEAFEKLAASALPFDQLIYECASWIHLAIAKPGQAPRRMVGRATGGPGHWIYHWQTAGGAKLRPTARPSPAPLAPQVLEPRKMVALHLDLTDAQSAIESFDRARAALAPQPAEEKPLPDPAPDDAKSWSPNASVAAGGFAGALTTVILGALESVGVHLTASMGMAIGVIVVSGVSYLHKQGRI